MIALGRAALPAIGAFGLRVTRPLAQKLFAAVLISVLVAALALSSSWQLIDNRLYDVVSTLWPATPDRPGAVIVAIDEPSFAELGKQWPWPRGLHANLIRSLRQAGARTIAFDVLFAEPSDPVQDAALRAAMGPDVVLASDEVFIRTDHADQITRVDPLPELIVAGAESGIVTVTLDRDGVLRRMPAAPDGFAATIMQRAGSAEPPVAVPIGALVQSFGGDRTYPTVSYYQALQPDVFLPPGFFRDRIVIVGLSLQSTPTLEAGGADAFANSHSAFTGRLVSGAEMQATILDNFGHGLFVLPGPIWALLAAVALGGTFGALSAIGGATWRTGALSLLLLVVAGALSYLLLRVGRIWISPGPPALSLVSVALAAAGLDFAAERRARKQIARAFEFYLAPQMVERLARDPTALKLGGERRLITIMFCDVRGFTSIAESMKAAPEELTLLLNRLFDPLSAAILDSGGTIDKYIGDCVMAFWNAPIEDPDHALHAVQCGLAMLDAIETLNGELAGQTSPFSIGIGINTGECVVGNMGSERRFDYTALGDAVNVAARCESLSKDYEVPIILAEGTARRVSDCFELVELDQVVLRGRTDRVPIFTVRRGMQNMRRPKVSRILQQGSGSAAF